MITKQQRQCFLTLYSVWILNPNLVPKWVSKILRWIFLTNTQLCTSKLGGFFKIITLVDVGTPLNNFVTLFWTCLLKSVYRLREKETCDFVYVTQFNNQLCSLNLALLSFVSRKWDPFSKYEE